MMRFVFVLLLAATLPHSAFADDHDANDAIKDAAQQWSEYYSARDLDALMTLYTPHAKLFAAGQPGLFGRDAIREYFKTAFARTKGGAIGFVIEEIRMMGDVATLVSKYQMRIDVGADKPVTAAGRSLLVYERDAFGHWLISADMDNKAPDADMEAFDKAAAIPED